MTRTSVKETLDQAKAAGMQIAQSVDALRVDIDRLKAERSQLLNSPVDKTVAYERVDRWVGAIRSKVGGPTVKAEVFTPSNPSWRLPALDFEAALSSFLAPLVGEVLRKELDALYEQIAPLGEDDRRERLGRIERRLLDLEMAEESIIRSSETGGFAILRRADADPAAVLAHDKALP